MKFRTLFLTTAILATATTAFAQTPTERAGSKTDNGTTQMQNDTKMAPSSNTNGMSTGMSGSTMSGPSTAGSSGATDSGAMHKNTSPASMDSGEKQQK